MLLVDRGAGERLPLGTDEVTVLATSAQTGGALFAVEMRVPPAAGPPRCTATPLARSTTSWRASSPSTSATGTPRTPRCGA